MSAKQLSARLEYFHAVRANDVDRVRAILGSYPGLVHERVADVLAERWEPADPGDRKSNTELHWIANHYNSDQSHVVLAQVLIDYGAERAAAGQQGA